MRGAGVLVVLTLAACRSPLAESDETGPPEDPQKVGVGVHGWPLYERAPGSKGVRTDVLWPVASVRTSETGELRRADVLVPIVLWERDGTRSRLGVRPLFDVETDDAVGAAVEDVDLLFPLVKWREAPGESRFEVRPFWWSRRSPERDHDVFFPFYGRWECRQMRADDGTGETPSEAVAGGSFLWPFSGMSWEDTRCTNWWASGLVLHQTDAEDSRDSWKLLLGALEKTTWDDGGEEFAFPLFSHRTDESEESSDWRFLWPGFVRVSREGDRTQDWALPFWYRDREGASSTTVLFPLWFEDEDQGRSLRMLLPLYGLQTRGDLERRFFGGNLLVTTSDPANDAGAVDVLWPLIHHGTDADGWDAHLFPLVWIDRHEDHAHTHLWPLYGHSRDGTESEHSVAWPFFTYESDTDGWEADVPFPFVEIDRRGTRHETRVWPLWSSQCDTDTGAYEGDVLWLLSNWEGDGGEKRDFRILWRLVQATDTGEKTVFAVNPFFRHETNDRGDDHWSALFGLVARTREADEVDWRLLWFIHL